jgi:hypothetical protein
VLSIVLTESELLLSGNYLTVEVNKRRRLVLLFGDFFAQQVFGFVAQLVANPRTDEAVAFLAVDDQDQVREALQKIALELLLALQGLLHGPALGHIDQRALVADDFPR